MRPNSLPGFFNITVEDEDWREEYQGDPGDQIDQAGQAEDDEEKSDG